MKFQVFRRNGEKGLTTDVEPSVDYPYGNRQHHNNLISVPDRNAGGINEHLVFWKLS